MPHECTIKAYHGTTESNAAKILATKHFKPSTKRNEWLGAGVYFFAYKRHAQWWTEANRYAGKNTCILAATLAYTEEQLLDLDDPNQLEGLNTIVEQTVKKMNESHSGVSVDFSQLTKQEKWNFSCNLVRKIHPKIGIIIYTFTPNYPPGIAGYRQNQRQICVSHEAIIQGIQRE